MAQLHLSVNPFGQRFLAGFGGRLLLEPVVNRLRAWELAQAFSDLGDVALGAVRGKSELWKGKEDCELASRRVIAEILRESGCCHQESLSRGPYQRTFSVRDVR